MDYTDVEILQAIHETILVIGGMGLYGLGMLLGLKFGG